MKRFKTQKGITLVALIITIVVLLILAVVAIGAIRDSNIIGYAQNAAGSYNQAKTNEISALMKYEEEIEKYVPGEKKEYLPGTDIRINATYYMWGDSNEETTLVVYNNGSAVLTIGDKVTEIPSFTIEDGKIKIPGMEISVIKEENNDILILESTNELMATSTNGFKYFNGEEYIFEDVNMIFKITLGKNESIHQGFNNGSESPASETTSPHTPFFYNGKVYKTFSDVIITSTDNCETLIYEGNTYSKSKK